MGRYEEGRCPRKSDIVNSRLADYDFFFNLPPFGKFSVMATKSMKNLAKNDDFLMMNAKCLLDKGLIKEYLTSTNEKTEMFLSKKIFFYFLPKQSLHNVCFIKICSKLSSVLLLCLLRIFMKQTLIFTLTIPQ